MVTEAKKRTVAELTDKFTRAKSLVFTDYRGLDVEMMTDLRARLREEQVEFRVVKNTLTGFALENAELKGLKDLLQGPTAIAFGYDDAVSPARALDDFIEDNDVLEIKGGVLRGSFVDVDQIQNLAKIPPREVLLGQVARGMQAPITGLANVLQGPIRNLAYALKAVQEQKEQ